MIADLPNKPKGGIPAEVGTNGIPVRINGACCMNGGRCGIARKGGPYGNGGRVRPSVPGGVVIGDRVE